MATSLDITVYRPASHSALAEQDLIAAHAVIAEIDRMMSLYRPDSELVLLNAKAGQGPVSVSAPIFEVLQAANSFARRSGGAFDVTVTPLVELWGFYRNDRVVVPSQDAIEEARRRVGMDRLTIDAAARAVALARETAIDLGAIAKGYAVDRAIAELKVRDVPAALVDLGGNIGVLGARPDGNPWKIGLQDPRKNGLIGSVSFNAGAVATSGDYDRYFEHDGQRYSHIIDPRTGWPVSGVAATTVIAPTAMAADALSTAGFVLGPEAGLALIASIPGAAGLVVGTDGRVAVQGTGGVTFELR